MCAIGMYANKTLPLKNIMQNFAEIIKSQEKLLIKTIKEQSRLDKKRFNQYNNIFLQQILLTGLQTYEFVLS